MATEIELKYQLSENVNENSTVVADITTLLQSKGISFEVDFNALENDYFDNDELTLRKLDFGLRIRSKGNKYEQTIKTAGEVVGSMHKRPEYNVDLSSKELDLALFPRNIWPEGVDFSALQQSLKVIFSTHFTRQTWLIHQKDSVIELALDCGDIATLSGSKSIVINEIEIELVSGTEASLFALAKQLKSVVAMEPSSVSKAARGYSLYYEDN